MNSAFALIPFLTACLAIDAEREMSSYDELVQEPIKPTSTFRGHPLSFAASAILDSGVDLSGVKGPFNNGSRSERLISITWSKNSLGLLTTSSSMVKNSLIPFANFETSFLPVALRYSSILLS